MNYDPSLVMTIEETSKYLRIPLSTLYKLAQNGKIPCQKIGRHWRFHRSTLIEWLAGRKLSSLQVEDITENK